MTTTIAIASRPKNERLRFTSALRSEWTKIRTVRSTFWTLFAIAIISLGVAAIAGISITHSWHTYSQIQRLTFDPTSTSLSGLLFSQLVIGVLGALVVSGEYATGTIRATFTAIPNRTSAMFAKTIVFGTLSLVVGEVLSFASFFLGQSLLTSPATHASISDSGVFRAVFGEGLVITALGLLALGLAMIIRSSAGAITAYVSIVLVLPIIIHVLPSSIANSIFKFLPLKIGNAMTTVVGPNDPTSFSPWVGLAILCGYAAFSIIIGIGLVVKRDA